MNIIYGDCYEKLDLIKDKTIQCIIIDPPYNINKTDWDNIPNYIEWLTNIVKKSNITYLLEKFEVESSFL